MFVAPSLREERHSSYIYKMRGEYIHHAEQWYCRLKHQLNIPLRRFVKGGRVVKNDLGVKYLYHTFGIEVNFYK